LRLDDDHSDDLVSIAQKCRWALWTQIGPRLENKISQLPEIFDQLQADLIEAGFSPGRHRPLLEFYRRSNELLIMVPVLPGPGVRPS